jgi:adenylosuccinate lyase
MTGRLVYNELERMWKESKWPGLLLDTIMALAFALKHYRKSQKSSAERVHLPGAFGMLLQMIFLARAQFSEI